MSEKNKDVVRGVYEFAKQGDFVRLAELMAPDYLMVQSPGHPIAGSWKGEAASAAAGRFYAALGIEEIAVQDIISDGPHRVMSLVELKGTDGNGERWSMPLIESFWVDQGKVTEVRPFYWDQKALDRILASRNSEPLSS